MRRTLFSLLAIAGFTLFLSACTGVSVVGAPAVGMDASVDAASCPGGTARCGALCADLRADLLNCGACGRSCGALQVCNNGSCQLTCPSSQSVCGGVCSSPMTDQLNCGSCGRACPAGTVCSMGQCATSCDARLATCGGSPDAGVDGGAASCADLATDNRNCGACGAACPLGLTCVAGACRVVCLTGETACGSACRDLRVDRGNCGACGTRCASGEVCAGGTCQVSCGASLVDCAGSCRDTKTDRAHCGGCGIACNAGEVCSGGLCRASCGGGLADCGGVCRDLATDRASCGACGTACAAGQVCSGGACAASCNAAQANCGGECRDLDRDRDHCGACATKCAAGEVCSRGECRVSCQPGLTACGGVCRDVQSDRLHCGACDATCAAGQRCSAGVCAATCAANRTACGADCIDVQSDNRHCGACDRACPAGTQCAAGVCGTTCARQLGTCGTGAMAYCANTSVDPANCGTCGTVCALAHASAEGCADGSCTIVRCETGFGDCDGSAANGCELDVRADPANCGGCGVACSFPNARSTCAAGACALGPCNPGYADCDRDAANGCEVDLSTDGGDCGACGSACAAGQVCTAGRCATTCTAPYATCGAGSASVRCANTASDPSNCAACGAACALPNVTAHACAGGCAVVACARGYGDCDGAAANGCETDTSASALHCGGCGRSCELPNASPVCAGGACAVQACAPGFRDCDGQARDGCEVDTRSDNLHCGACGHACGPTEVCNGGACASTCTAPLSRCVSTAGASGHGGPFCADLPNDPANCGRCGAQCRLPNVEVPACSAGSCAVLRCAAGFADCDGVASNGCEVDVRESNDHCGACGFTCAPPNAVGRCTGGVCGVLDCQLGFADCNGLAADGCEVNTTSSSADCGACGTRCPAGQVCSAGRCATSCAAPFTTCGSATAMFCADTGNDTANCGACGTPCALEHASSTLCAGGTCSVFGCSAGFGDCDGNSANGCEVALFTSAAHCGACGRACALPHAAGVSCVAGDCAVSACAAGFDDCNRRAADGCEANLGSDPANCGGCGASCPAGAACANGRCVSSCPGGQDLCGGTCTNRAYDPDHCRTCETVCPTRANALRWCSEGACGFTCATGRGDCDSDSMNGCEVDLTTTAAHCGACGRPCGGAGATGSCVAGACVLTCSAGLGNCDGNDGNGCETSTTTSVAHCGSCGHACAAGQVCSGGVCVIGCSGATPDRCGGACTNTQSDTANCGACASACSAAGVNTVAMCLEGECGSVCATGFASCDGNAGNGCEVNTSTSLSHCGACGAVCGSANATPTCTGGNCTLACAAGFGNCDGNRANGCETNTNTSGAHCGGCGMPCGSGQACEAGVCVISCTGTTPNRCGVACVNTQTDRLNCGTCGFVCPGTNTVSTPVCAAGACGLTCAAGFGNCDNNLVNGCETSTTTVTNCGACGVACGDGQVCTAGVCVAACPGSTPNLCSGACVNTQTDASNCGTCGNFCLGSTLFSTPTCVGGVCALRCAAGLGNCDGNLINGCETSITTVTNCGACGVACGAGQVCTAGACVACSGATPNLCSGVCVNTQTNTSHCGTCGSVCPGATASSTPVCTGGVCGLRCSAGAGNCDNNPVNGCEALLTTVTNCGACGVACGAGQLCTAGVCVATWEEVTPPSVTAPMRGSMSDVVPAGGDFIYYAGLVPVTFAARFARYSISGRSWSDLTPPPSQLFSGSLALVGTNLYSFLSGSIYRYSITGDSWSTVATGVSSQTDSSQTTRDGSGNLFAFGDDNRVIRFDTNTSALTRINTTIMAHSFPRMAYDPTTSLLYVMPNASTGVLFSVDPTSGTTVALATNTNAINNTGMCGDRAGHLYRVGGLQTQYTISSNTWTVLPTLPISLGTGFDLRYASCTVTSDGYLWMASGTNPGWFARLRVGP